MNLSVALSKKNKLVKQTSRKRFHKIQTRDKVMLGTPVKEKKEIPGLKWFLYFFLKIEKFVGCLVLQKHVQKVTNPHVPQNSEHALQNFY